MNPNMAPVPSVCVRVPHSPSFESQPCSPMKKITIGHDLTALAVRECASRVHVTQFISNIKIIIHYFSNKN